jgi:hypothetical protein
MRGVTLWRVGALIGCLVVGAAANVAVAWACAWGAGLRFGPVADGERERPYGTMWALCAGPQPMSELMCFGATFSTRMEEREGCVITGCGPVVVTTERWSVIEVETLEAGWPARTLRCERVTRHEVRVESRQGLWDTFADADSSERVEPAPEDVFREHWVSFAADPTGWVLGRRADGESPVVLPAEPIGSGWVVNSAFWGGLVGGAVGLARPGVRRWRRGTTLGHGGAVVHCAHDGST